MTLICMMEKIKVAERLQLLRHWLEGVLNSADFGLAPASNDASFRRYFRVGLADRSYIAMDAPPDKEDCGPFVRIARAMHAAGLHVPVVYAEDPVQGFLLLDDLGSVAYLDALNADSAEQLYTDAMTALLHLQSSDILMKIDLPPYNEALLVQEMSLFRDWYLGTHLSVELAPAQQVALQSIFKLLVENALAQPQVCVHRDYHSRNLMVVPDNNPGIIDFQDAVVGPVTYDLVSLLRDCYIQWPRERVEAWVMRHCDALINAGVVKDSDRQHFLRWFDLMGVQRHLKVAGIFARLNYRDGKPGYLKDIPLTLEYVREVAGRYAELSTLVKLLAALPE